MTCSDESSYELQIYVFFGVFQTVEFNLHYVANLLDIPGLE